MISQVVYTFNEPLCMTAEWVNRFFNRFVASLGTCCRIPELALNLSLLRFGTSEFSSYSFARSMHL
jgi:hypothetical protein